MISIKALKALAAAGASADMIIAAVETDMVVYEERRRIDAERKRRERRTSKDGHGRPSPSADVLGRPRTESQDLDLGNPVQPTSGSDRERPAELAKAAKKKGPHTPKEKTLTPSGESTRARSNGTRLPEDWKPTLDEIAFARKYLAAAVVPNEVLKFRNYWLARSGAGATKRDWHRTFENWCISAAERNPRNLASSSTNRSWKDERAEDNYRASKAWHNEFVGGDSTDDEAAGGDSGGENARVVLDLEPARPAGLHAGASRDVDEIPFFDRRARMRGGSQR